MLKCMERTAGNKKGIEYGMRERKTTAFWGGDQKGSYCKPPELIPNTDLSQSAENFLSDKDTVPS